LHILGFTRSIRLQFSKAVRLQIDDHNFCPYLGEKTQPDKTVSEEKWKSQEQLMFILCPREASVPQ